MTNPSIPYFYMPTQIIVIDDNENYLNALQLTLSEYYRVKAFTNPQKALDYIQAQSEIHPTLQSCQENSEYEHAEHTNQNFNIQKISETIYNKERFNSTSVIIADYAMPGMNGLDLFAKIKEKTFKKMLLTGEADDKLAVMAFNHNMIDQFVKKSWDITPDEILAKTKELERNYFNELSSKIYNPLLSDEESNLNCVAKKEFIDYFNEIFTKNKIVEFYLTDTNAGFLLLDRKGKPYWLATRTAQELKEFSELASSYDEVPQFVIDTLLKNEKIPYFFKEEHFQKDPKDWDELMHNAKAIGDGLFVALIEADENYKLNEYTSYQTYLEQITNG